MDEREAEALCERIIECLYSTRKGQNTPPTPRTRPWLTNSRTKATRRSRQRITTLPSTFSLKRSNSIRAISCSGQTVVQRKPERGSTKQHSRMQSRCVRARYIGIIAAESTVRSVSKSTLPGQKVMPAKVLLCTERGDTTRPSQPMRKVSNSKTAQP